MGRITKEQRQKFADAFIICQNGKRAMEAAGIEFEVGKMQKLMMDRKLADYIDRNVQTVQYMLGRTKEGHIAKLERLFDMATGTEKSKQVNFTKTGQFVEVEGYFTDYKGATALSKRLAELLDWELSEDGNNNIVVDLQISDSLFKTDEEAELEEAKKQSNERDNKVLNHLKAEGIL